MGGWGNLLQSRSLDVSRLSCGVAPLPPQSPRRKSKSLSHEKPGQALTPAVHVPARGSIPPVRACCSAQARSSDARGKSSGAE